MILAIVGPTGVGKTKMSVELAKHYDGIVINCDAMQVYKDLNIGTAKITEEEKEGVPHLLFDIKNVSEEYSIYDYQKDVRQLLEEYKEKTIIFVGGTGLYLKAALYDYRLSEEGKKKKNFSSYTNEELYEMVLKKDASSQIHKNNRIRMERFLNKETLEEVPPVPLYPHLILGLTTERENLYSILDARVDKQLEDGLLDEVKSFYDRKIYSKPLLNGIGYKELYKYFDGSLPLEEAISLLKKNTRHYAKRQYTFFNHQLPVHWIDVNYQDFDETIQKAISYIEEQKKNL